MTTVESESNNALRQKKILLAHTNVGDQLKSWHLRRERVANDLGYNLSTVCMSDSFPYTIFPRLDRLWKNRDPRLLRFYDELGEKISKCDVFIHYNGLNIHPDFLSQFSCLKVYHCADDPDATAVVSRPVANTYDICAISNPACIDMYKRWGCKEVFFWPIGSYHYKEDGANYSDCDRDLELSFVGSKYGSPRFRFVNRVPGLRNLPFVYRKRAFFEKIEAAFPQMRAYGPHWPRGFIDDLAIPDLYSRTKVGINVHNSLGPINARLYELAAFGVCQICDNKSNLHYVFEVGKEVVGFDTVSECVDLVHHYLSHPDLAREIGENGRRRYLNDYTIKQIWKRFFENLGAALHPKNVVAVNGPL